MSDDSSDSSSTSDDSNDSSSTSTSSYGDYSDASSTSSYSTSSETQTTPSTETESIKSSDMIAAEFKEFRLGLQSFQEEAFEKIYDKQIKWRSTLENAIETKEDKTEAAKPVTEKVESKVIQPQESKVKPITEVYDRPTVGVVPSTNKEVDQGIVLKTVPLSEKKPAPSPDDQKKDVLRAQQAIAQSFLSYGGSLSETDINKMEELGSVVEDLVSIAEEVLPSKNKSKLSPAPPAASGLFDFFSPRPVEVVAPSSPSPPVRATPATTTPAPAPIPVSKEIVSSESSKKPSSGGGGLFGLFGSKSDETTAPVAPAAPAPSPPVAAKKTAPMVTPASPPKVVEAPASSSSSQPFGGLLNFLKSDPNVDLVASKAAPAAPKKIEKILTSKPAPIVSPPPPAAPVAKAAPKATPPPPVKAERPVVASRSAVAPAAPPAEKPVAAAPPASSGGGGGLFGLFGSKPATPAAEVVESKPAVASRPTVAAAKVEAKAVAPNAEPRPTVGQRVTESKPVAPVVKAPEPVSSSSDSSSSSGGGGGLFGFFGGKKEEVKVAEKLAVVAAKPAPVAAKPAPVVVAKPAPVVVKPAPVVAKPTPVVAKPAPVVVSKPVPAASTTTTTSTQQVFRSSSAWVPSLSKPPSKEIKSIPAGMKPADGPSMNVKYQQSASDLLRKDPSKLRSFQKATDQVRSGAIGVDEYLKTLESLFNRADLEAVVNPLVEGLPEKEVAKLLKEGYKKKYGTPATTAAAEPSKSLFGFFGKKTENVDAVAPPVAAPTKTTTVAAKTTTVAAKTQPVAAKATTPSPAATATTDKPSSSSSSSSSGGLFGFFGSSSKPATPPAAAAPAVKLVVPSKVPAAKKTVVENLLKALVAGTSTPEAFYADVSKAIGKATTKDIIPEISSQIPKDKGAKLSAIAKADK